MLPIQVYGQPELVNHLENGGICQTHLISIGNPRRWFGRNGVDTRVPEIFHRHFDRILRLSFYDVEQKRHLRSLHFPKRIPARRDVRRAIRFYKRTKHIATGYTIHCWQGVSRSTAFALGFLYMISGSEEEAARQLKNIRPEAGPHQKIVGFFDQELGCNLRSVNQKLRAERLEAWKRELNLDADELLEELAEVE